jgi:hypothetical protein
VAANEPAWIAFGPGFGSTFGTHPARQNSANCLVRAPLFHPIDQSQLMIAGMFSVMPSLRRSASDDMRVQCNMNFFSSSRKVFAPVYSTEYKAKAIRSDAATRRSALFLEGSPWKRAGSDRAE